MRFIKDLKLRALCVLCGEIPYRIDSAANWRIGILAYCHIIQNLFQQFLNSIYL